MSRPGTDSDPCALCRFWGRCRRRDQRECPGRRLSAAGCFHCAGGCSSPFCALLRGTESRDELLGHGARQCVLHGIPRVGTAPSAGHQCDGGVGPCRGGVTVCGSATVFEVCIARARRLLICPPGEWPPHCPDQPSRHSRHRNPAFHRLGRNPSARGCGRVAAPRAVEHPGSRMPYDHCPPV